MSLLHKFQIISILLLCFTTACSSLPQSTVVVFPTSTIDKATITPVTATATTIQSSEIQIPNVDKFPTQVEIVFWYSWSGEAADVVEELVSAFNASNPWNVKVQPVQSGDVDYMARQLNSFLEGRNSPNVIATEINYLRGLYLQNIALDLTAYIQHPKWGIPEQEQILYPISFWQQDVTGNSHYGLPAERNGYFLFYNQTWAKELGFKSPPSSPEEFLNQSCAAARNNSFDGDPGNNGTGGWIFDSRPSTVLSWLRSFEGGQLPVREGEPYKLQNTNNEKAFAFLQQLMRLGCSWFPRENDPYQYFSERKALFYSGSLEDIPRQHNFDMIDEWQLIPYPSENENEIILSDGLSYGILPSDSTHDLAAWLFIRWMQKPENQSKLISVTYSFPLTSNVRETYKHDKPDIIWEEIQKFLPQVKSMPLLDSWPNIGRVLQDAAWQVVQSNMKPGDIKAILLSADNLIKELIDR